jgi:urea transport system permease protein
LRTACRAIAILIAVAALLVVPSPARADEEQVRVIISKFATAKGFGEVESIIDELAVAGDPLAVPALRGLSDGMLQISDDGNVVIASGTRLLDPVTLEPVEQTSPEGSTKIRIKNSIRRKIAEVLSGLTLNAADPKVRRRAAATIFTSADASQLEALETAISAEKDPQVLLALRQARASILLATSSDEAALKGAIATMRDRGDRESLALLTRFESGANGPAKAAAREAIDATERHLAAWNAAQNIWYGISLGSVLFLAAIGLAITFGVMGIINMAHGEMVMLGAYTTFVTQEAIRQSAPWLFEYSLAIALPLAFLVSGLVGLALERGIIRFLYGRPLETLLATWGVSLILQQTVRTIFGPTNREVGNPDWMSGAMKIGEMSITWNRLWIVVFSLAVFAVLLAVLNRTSFGLQMRAVTQNRRMASAMGIRTPWVDAMTFALGSGIAGIAGVALSQIDNVSPNLGQSYIIDSFMVVVFGGVGNLWGTLIGALSLGVANKFLEPYAGAVLGKILVLVFIILFIQRRPRGLFALRGRAVEA